MYARKIHLSRRLQSTQMTTALMMKMRVAAVGCEGFASCEALPCFQADLEANSVSQATLFQGCWNLQEMGETVKTK